MILDYSYKIKHDNKNFVQFYNNYKNYNFKLNNMYYKCQKYYSNLVYKKL